jgi:hypothetical protein
MILIFFVVAALASPSLAADYKRVGVSAGDSIDYSVSYYSTSPDFPESQYVSDGYNRVHVDVRGIVGTNVTLLVTFFYPDNRTSSMTWSGDISKNLCDYLIIAGLGVGDVVCAEAKDFSGTELTVRETVSMTILGTQRKVNIVIASMALDAEEILYYEKATGILVESHRSSLAFGWRVERIVSLSSASGSQVDPVTGVVTVVASLAILGMISTVFAVMDRRQRH